MIHYDPVEFIGTIHTKSSGASLARFKELALRYGDFINVTYRNDVMPYVSKVDCAHNRDNPNPIIEFPTTCPVCDTALVVTDSGKKALCPNVDCPGRSIQRMVNMFAKMNIKGFADATFGVLHKDHLWQLPLMNKAELCTILGNADGENFYNAIQQLMTTPQKDYIIMGSLGFSSMAHKKWQEILTQIRLKDIEDLFIHSKDVFEFRYKLSEVIKTGTATLNTIAEQWTFFAKDIEFVLNNIPLIESYGNLNVGKKQIRFSGIRNEQLAEQLSTLGYDADDNGSVTKKTDILLIPYEGFTSNKTQKASTNPRTLIVPIQDFINNMDKYLQ
jgi:NAD-dependent DNA ligase